jgi:hypothetical protein
LTRSRRRWLIAGLLFGALAAGVGSFALAVGLRYATAPTRIEIAATPIDSFDNRDSSQTRFGELEFRGGLALTAQDSDFGGISHSPPSRTEQFIAVTDHGSLAARPYCLSRWQAAGVTDAEIAPILGLMSAPLATHGSRYDTESIAEFDGMSTSASSGRADHAIFTYRSIMEASQSSQRRVRNHHHAGIGRQFFLHQRTRCCRLVVGE